MPVLFTDPALSDSRLGLESHWAARAGRVGGRWRAGARRNHSRAMKKRPDINNADVMSNVTGNAIRLISLCVMKGLYYSLGFCF